ncbi:MAG: alpha/beta hydrolase [Paludibacteraceae bacterium]|nr:alpha/beta hydrolase [Paludibacteraceae bacterium]
MRKLLLGAIAMAMAIGCTKAVTTNALTLVSAKVPSFTTKLTKEEAETKAESAFEIKKLSYTLKYDQAWYDQVLRLDSLRMPFTVFVSGERPADGYPIFLSLHGGGGTAPEVNDQQYENQKHLYDNFLPSQCIYIAPRAPFNTWDLWFKPELDSLLTTLVNLAVVNLGGNPNRVYLMGYSAGGDGVWRLAPRLADHWAAASMMAGHPGDVSLANLRNTPFMMWVGENDEAYNRNAEVAKRGVEMDQLQAQDTAGYKHVCTVVKDKGHWMDLEDGKAIEWMMQHTRNTMPQKVVWQQEEVTERSLYWLSVPPTVTPQRGDKVTAEIDENTIRVSKCSYPELTIWLNDSMVDLDSPVTIIYDGKTIYKGKFPRKDSVIEESIANRNDFGYYFSSKVTLLIEVVK